MSGVDGSHLSLPVQAGQQPQTAFRSFLSTPPNYHLHRAAGGIDNIFAAGGNNPGALRKLHPAPTRPLSFALTHS